MTVMKCYGERPLRADDVCRGSRILRSNTGCQPPQAQSEARGLRRAVCGGRSSVAGGVLQSRRALRDAAFALRTTATARDLGRPRFGLREWPGQVNRSQIATAKTCEVAVTVWPGRRP